MSVQGRPLVQALCALALLCGWGCTKRTLKPLNPCLVSAVGAKLEVNNIDKVDMLFMVDNSNSMKQEQTALREQFPRLIRALTTGDRDLDGKADFRAVTDLHLGVVSSNMGVGNVGSVAACLKSDDGLLQHTGIDPMQAGCNGTNFPAFLSYKAGVDDSTRVVNSFSCVASLGVEGCGFEQQLESALKALWPSTDGKGGAAALPFGGPFVSTEATSSTGHGDKENAGFLRSGVGVDRSLVAIVLVTDEEDCSSANTHHFADLSTLAANDPLQTQPDAKEPNLRCFHNPSELFPVERYVKGFQALRPDEPGLVVFAAIVGVPELLVNAQARAKVDFTDTQQRDAYYDGILADEKMQEVIDPASYGSMTGGNLFTSCRTATGDAYPPRRIVQVAKQMGENGLVQSICQSDFTPALDAIIQLIASKIDALCLPHPLVRNAKGTVDCDMIWELPAPSADLPSGTPTACGSAGWEFLLPADPRLASGRKGAVCKMAQLAVRGRGTQSAVQMTENDGQVYSDGWFYDDFRPELAMSCPSSARQGIGFTSKATPPSGVTVKLQCLNEVQTLPNHRSDLKPGVAQPAIGDACEEVQRDGQTLRGDAACVVTLADGRTDAHLRCHQELNVCVLSCDTTADCPAAWVCDARPETTTSAGTKICVNPTCGDLNE